MGLFALFEYRAVLRKSGRVGFAQDFTELVGLNPANSGRWATSEGSTVTIFSRRVR
jgi:hypothetical protein